jgi:acetoin utilization deacetylase AcuC-like enzyme
MVAVIYSDEFLQHDTGVYHPEKPGRLTAIVEQLRAVPWADQLEWRSPTPISPPDRVLKAIEQVHPRPYIEAIQQFAAEGGGHLDSDTPVSPHSYEVALLAISAWLDGVDYVLSNGEPAFVLARPPGHHALPTRPMGFCIFSNAAIAAHYALHQPGVNQVAILDWDVHHGNGTQAIAAHNPHIAYCSLHEFPQYPGTGAAHERGDFNNVLNFPMLAGSTLQDYEPLFKEKIVPFLRDFAPDLLIVSAGYDATKADPLASICLQPEDYGVFTRYCQQVTPKILFGLEGGYDFKALAQSVVETLAVCV